MTNLRVDLAGASYVKLLFCRGKLCTVHTVSHAGILVIRHRVQLFI